ncbi:MAG: GNAT family N-acetyltransferase [Spirochaetales bacterium]|nr:GNAT family N-acetyltransferase [Spirochaetales bacterium]
MITHRDYRKRGFGEAIMNEAVSIAKDKRCYKVMLMSSAKRVEAHGFYEKIGFDGNSKKGFQLRLS